MSIVVPFYGDAAAAAALGRALGALRLCAGDEVIVADNTEDGRFARAAAPGARIVPASLERSSYYARNVGVEASASDWLLFLDSDCRPSCDLLCAYFAPPPASDVGIVSGAVLPAHGQRELIARYAASRRHIDPDAYRPRPGRRAAGITANLLVRRSAWEDVGGFQEGIRSGADLDFCWRAQDAGWSFAWRPAASVEHEHVATLAQLRRKTVRHAGGGGWVERHHPGAFSRPALGRQLLRCAVGVLGWLALLKPRRALYKGIDAIFLSFDAFGRLTGNRAVRDEPVGGGPSLVVLADRWPDAEEPDSVARVIEQWTRTPTLEVEALARPRRPDRLARRQVRVTYAEDDGWLRRMVDAIFLVARHPLKCLRFVRAAPRGAGRPGIRVLAPVARRLLARNDVDVRASNAAEGLASFVEALTGGPG